MAILAASPESSAIVIQPHPVLPRYYQDEDHRRPFVKRMFDDAAPQYDRLETLMSFGSGSWYRRQALKRAGLLPGMKVLDVAVGTGLVAREALEIVGSAGRVIGIDPSIGMLSQAAGSLPIGLVQGRAEELPFAPDAFDFLCMGFALRHVSDLTRTLRQFISVLKPGGILLILEITAPPRGIRRRVMADFVQRLVPALSRLLPGMRTSQTPNSGRLMMEYYWDTMTHCVDPEQVLQTIAASGFSQPRRRTELGIFSEYTAAKPSAG